MTAGRRLRLAVCHPRLRRGGSEIVAMRSIEALKDEYDVSLVTLGEVDLAALDEWSGTSIAGTDLQVRSGRVPLLLRRARAGDALWGAYYQRFCRKVAPEFDVLISAYNLCDFGTPAIHQIADFSWDPGVRATFDVPPPSGLRSRFHRRGVVRGAYRALVRAVSRPSGRDLFSGEDLILANSQWSAEIVARRHGARAEVVYPPVWLEGKAVAWESRLQGFASIGRVSPEKRIAEMIGIIDRVRRRGHDICLHVAGDVEETPYVRSVQHRVAAAGAWMSLAGEMSGAEKTKLLSSHRFGVHACRGEAFGIAVAEMVKAGCVVFAPALGGQAEILAHSALLYDDEDDAVDKIDRLLRSPDLLRDVRAHLKGRATLFTTDTFAGSLRAAVRRFIGSREDAT